MAVSKKRKNKKGTNIKKKNTFGMESCSINNKYFSNVLNNFQQNLKETSYEYIDMLLKLSMEAHEELKKKLKVIENKIQEEHNQIRKELASNNTTQDTLKILADINAENGIDVNSLFEAHMNALVDTFDILFENNKEESFGRVIDQLDNVDPFAISALKQRIVYISSIYSHKIADSMDEILKLSYIEGREEFDRVSHFAIKDSLYLTCDIIEKDNKKEFANSIRSILDDFTSVSNVEKLIKLVVEEARNNSKKEKENKKLEEIKHEIKESKERYQKEKMYKYIELNKIAIDNGFECLRHNGDHGIYAKGDKTIIIPQGREIGRGLQKRILKVLLSDSSRGQVKSININ